MFSKKFRLAVGAALTIMPAVITGICGCVNPFAPKLGDVGSGASLFLTSQHAPEEVLINFHYAYTLKDSLVYRDLLDDDFVFVWRDYDNDTFVSWGKEDDIRTTIGLFDAFSVIDLIWNSTNYITYSDDSVRADVSKGFILTFDSQIRITGEALFSMKKSKETGIWRITRWVDKSVG